MNFKTRLQPFASLYRQIYNLIEAMPDHELKALLKATEKPTETNCGWNTYDVAPIVKRMAKSEISRRKYAAKRDAAIRRT